MKLLDLANTKVSDRKEFLIHQKNGMIVLIPKVTNPYLHSKKGDFNTHIEWEECQPQGNEVDERGDIIWMDFEPSKGHKIKKRRSALTISRDEYGAVVSFLRYVPYCQYVMRPSSLVTLESVSND